MIVERMQKRSFANALKWAYMGNIGDRAISALVTVVLAGILGPREFGLVSIALIYINFMQMFLDQGLAVALIQKKDLKQEHCDAVFWLNLWVSLCFVGVTILISGWWARINHAPELARLLSVLSLGIPIEGLCLVQAAMVRREMDFKSLTIRSNVSVLIGGIVGLGMAVTGFGLWSLVGMQLCRDFSGLLLLWKLGRWRPQFEFSWPHLKELMSFSIHNFSAGLGTFADLQAGSILLGLLFGPVAVGLYRLAERLTGSVVSMATTSIQGVSLPEFSRLQDQPSELRKSALSCIRLSSVVTVPALAGMAAVSGPLMASLGPKWVPSTNVLRILCVQGMILSLSYFTGPLLTALGRPKMIAKLEWARAVVGVLFLVGCGLLLRNSAANWQVTGIALARSIPNIFFVTPISLYLLMHFAGVSLRDLLGAIRTSALSGVGIAVAVLLFVLSSVAVGSRPLVLLLLESSIGGLAGLAVLLILDEEIRGLVLGMLSRLWRFSEAAQ
jgi:O-antigen/teichoic acid export membrane protein